MSSVAGEARSIINCLSYLFCVMLAPLVFRGTDSLVWSCAAGLSTCATTCAIMLEMAVSSKSIMVSYFEGFGLLEWLFYLMAWLSMVFM